MIKLNNNLIRYIIAHLDEGEKGMIGILCKRLIFNNIYDKKMINYNIYKKEFKLNLIAFTDNRKLIKWYMKYAKISQKKNK